MQRLRPPVGDAGAADKRDLAVDNEQLADAYFGVERKLTPGADMGADDLDGEIRTAEPVRTTVARGVACQENGDVRATVVDFQSSARSLMSRRGTA